MQPWQHARGFSFSLLWKTIANERFQSGGNQFESVDVDQSAVGDLQVRNDGQRQEG